MDIESLLDPEIADYLRQTPPGGPFTLDQLVEIREQRRAASPVPVLSGEVDQRDVRVPGPAGAPEVLMRIYRPKRATGALPCIYWVHGGGYVFGAYDTEDIRFDKWCGTLQCVGVSVEYRLAPETPYPGPLEDCYAGLAWIHQNADTLGVDAARIGIGGASAGGGLAAGLALLVRDRGEIPLIFQLLLYPMIDDRRVSASSRWEVPIWPPLSNERGWAAYLGGLEGEAVPAYAAPARATDLSNLPPAFIPVGALDGFLDEDIDYAQRLMHAGVPTKLSVYPGGPHGFDSLMPRTSLARRARRDMEEWLSAQMGR